MHKFTCLFMLSMIGLAFSISARAEKPVCLDSKQVRNWIVINDETLFLDAGRKKYRVALQQSCFNLSTSPILSFKGDPISGRVCGSSLDAVRVQGEQCRISKIEEIDKKTLNEAHNRKRLSVVGRAPARRS
jgi:Family of unknown function (DUF6491)